MRISDWSSDVCSSDLFGEVLNAGGAFVLGQDQLVVDQDVGIGRDGVEARIRLGPVRNLAGLGRLVFQHLTLVEELQPAVHRRGDDQVGRPGARTLFGQLPGEDLVRSEEHTSELQSLMRISYAVFCLKKKKTQTNSKQQQHNKH